MEWHYSQYNSTQSQVRLAHLRLVKSKLVWSYVASAGGNRAK